MDDLLREFLTETNESLDRVDAELVRFEQEPNNGEFRDGMPVTTEAVTLILSTIDRIKTILEELEAEQREPSG